MNRNSPTAALGMTLLTLLAAAPAQSQALPKVFVACYVQNTGTTYRIREPSLPAQCTNVTKHIEFSWVDGVPGHDHGVLNGLADDDHPQYLLASGSRPLAGDLQLGGFRITGLAAGTGPGDAVRFEQAVKVGQTASGDLSGAYPDPKVTRIQGQAVAATAPTNGQVLAFDGTAWTPLMPTTGTRDHGLLDGLTDDDHPQYLLTTGIRASNGLAITGKVGDRIPIEGAGVRLLWHPGKAAFRAGLVDGREWDDVNVGQSSTALGWNTTASGDYSTALGANASTNGQQGAFVYGDVTTKDPVVATAPNQFLVRAAGGLRLFNSVATDRFTYEHGSGTGCEIFTGPRSNYSGSLTCTGLIEATEGGFRFPDGTIQATAATSGTSDHGSLSGLGDDDHPQYLLGDGVRASTNGFAVTGSVGAGTVPVSGSGVRLMWVPAKAALRAGSLDDSHTTWWDAPSLGVGSTAFGLNTNASEAFSFACCAEAAASGQGSAVLGSASIASGVHATAIGNSLTASGDYSMAFGFNGNTNGMSGSIVFGDATGGAATRATTPNAFVVRAQNVWFGRSGDQPASPAGYFTADGVIASTTGGFKFPDGTIQTTAVVGAGSDHGALSGLTDDDHSQYLLGDGVRATANGFAVTGSLGSGAIPVSGEGIRLMWFPGKAAFRAGRAFATSWDDENVGQFSIALGNSTVASGFISTALGNGTKATGDWSTALGSTTTASGSNSTAMGQGSTASGAFSIAMGQGANATAPDATAIGRRSSAIATSATALGDGDANGASSFAVLGTAYGQASIAIGVGTSAIGWGSVAIGMGSNARGDSAIALGAGTNAFAENSMAMGYGTSAIGANSTSMGYQTSASGDYSTAMGYRATARNVASTAMGSETDATGPNTTAMGERTMASGNTSTAMGSATVASGPYSIAMGGSTTAGGIASTAMGAVTTASGDYSTAMGNRTTATNNASTAMGAVTTASGIYSTAMGREALAGGENSTAMGYLTRATGTSSTAMGERSDAFGHASTSMGWGTEATGDHTTAMGRRASTNGHTGSFVYGDASSGTTDVHATADNSFVVRSEWVWFGRDGDQIVNPVAFINTSTSAFLSLGGSWINSSDVNRKENFQDEDTESVLDRLAHLPMRSWNYRAENPNVRHLGPTAQDFYAAFHLGDSDRTISTVDEGGVALAAIQALERRTKELRDSQVTLEQRTRDFELLRSTHDELLRRVRALEAALARLTQAP